MLQMNMKITSAYVTDLLLFVSSYLYILYVFLGFQLTACCVTEGHVVN